MSPTKFEARNANCFEQRAGRQDARGTSHSPAPVSANGQHEREAMDNPAPVEIEVSNIIIGTSQSLGFLQRQTVR